MFLKTLLTEAIIWKNMRFLKTRKYEFQSELHFNICDPNKLIHFYTFVFSSTN